MNRTKMDELNLETFTMEKGVTLVEASAGTGKTFTIQYMVLDLLLQGIPLSEVLIVTFTEAATKELKGRLLTFLQDVQKQFREPRFLKDPLAHILKRSVDKWGEKNIQNRLNNAMISLDEIAVFTIHGFCQRSLQENVFAADSDYQSEVFTDLRRAVTPFVQDFLREANLSFSIPLPAPYKFENLLNRAIKLNAFRACSVPLRSSLEEDVNELTLLSEKLKSFVGQEDRLLKEFFSWQGKLNKKSYSDKFYNDLHENLSVLIRSPFSSEAKFLELCSASTIEKKVNGKFVGQVTPSAFFQHCAKFSEERVHFENRSLAYFDHWFIKAFTEWKEETGSISFDDIIKKFRRVLSRSSTLVEQIQQKYKAAIVDEFQDTDAEQYTIFSLLFGDRNTGHYFAMIGDPKQSIYRFRGADLPTYLEARRNADRMYTLGVNYRSEQSLIDGVNAFFEGVNFSASFEEDDQINFYPVRAPRLKKSERLLLSDFNELPKLWEKGVPVLGRIAHGNLNSHTLAETVADVRKMIELSHEGKIVFEKRLEEKRIRRKVSLSDIAILVNQHSEAEILSQGLAEIGVKSLRKSEQSVFTTKEAKDLYTFMSCCLKAKEKSVHAFLISPLGVGSLGAFLALSKGDKQGAFEALASYGSDWRSGCGIGKVFYQLLHTGGVRQRLLSQPDGERRLTNYIHLIQILDEEEKQKNYTNVQLLIYLKKLIISGGDDSLDGQEVRLESDQDAVTIMTLHSSKGLEFPIVFLPTLWSRSPKKSKEVVFEADQEHPDSFFAERVHESAEEETLAEDRRLGYVAMTRAVHLCIYYNITDFEMPSSRQAFAKGWFGESYPLRDEGRLRVASDIFSKIASAEPITLEIADDEKPIFPRHFTREKFRKNQITSFTALHQFHQEGEMGIDEEPVQRGRDEKISSLASFPDTLSEVVEEEEESLLLGSFIPGARTGTCLHEILDDCNFAEPNSWSEEIEKQINHHFPSDSKDRRDKKLSEVSLFLKQLTAQHYPLIDSTETIDFSSLAKENCFYELDFYFPIEQLDISRLGDVLSLSLERMGVPSGISYLSVEQVDGFLTGSIDLFFKQGEQFFILDWKTNRLPFTASRYDKRVMEKLMVEGGYYLQALIYSVAGYLFLRRRYGAQFSYDRHCGGFIYCFVRGLSEETGWLHQSFTEKEIVSALQALGHRSLKTLEI